MHVIKKKKTCVVEITSLALIVNFWSIIYIWQQTASYSNSRVMARKLLMYHGMLHADRVGGFCKENCGVWSRRSEHRRNGAVSLVRRKLWARGGATVNSALRHLSVVCLPAAGGTNVPRVSKHNSVRAFYLVTIKTAHVSMLTHSPPEHLQFGVHPYAWCPISVFRVV